MGVKNYNNALYMATGIDNTGLYEGKREAMGIIKALASEVTSFDIFSGIGISAATAFAQAAKSSYDFEQEFRKNMLEVATISTQVSDDMTGFMNQVMDITREIPIKAPEAARALYEIVSAGHDGANGMKILEVSARSAIGGLTETATAADAITTILNAYNLSADKASSVSDQLFTTVRLGKTTFGELGSSIAQVAPIAAAYGIGIDEVLAAVASLTKQGTPTAEAMTKIRAAIQGTANELGDAAFQGRTFQEALQLINEKAGGSASKMKEMLGTDEGLAAALALTGKNARSAASDLEELRDSLGATEAAFGKMKDEAGNQLILLANNIQAYLRPLGENILKEVSDIAKAFNDAFENNDIEGTISNLESLVKNAVGAFLSYKTAILLVQVAQNSYAKTSALSRLATIQHTTATTLLTGALRKQAVAMLAAGKAALTNPYVLAVAGVTALGFAIFKLATQASASEKALDEHNRRVAKMKGWSDDMRDQTEEMLGVLRDENKSTLQKVEAYKKLQELYPGELKNLSLQKFLLMDMVEVNKMLSKSLDDRTMAKQRATVNSIEKEMTENSKRISQLDKKSWIDTSLSEALELRRLRKRNEQLKVEYDKAVEIVVQGLKDRTKAEALANGQSKQKETTYSKAIDDKELEKQKKLQKELLALRRQNQQAEIDLMKEGSAKKIAQINLDYDNEIASILAKEKEWKDAQDGKLTLEQTVEVRKALVNAQVKRDKNTSQVEMEELEADREAMNEYLMEYGTFQQKKMALAVKYSKMISEAIADGNEGKQLSLSKEWDKELTDLEIETGNVSNAIIALFGDMSGKSLHELEELGLKGKEALEFVKNGEWDASIGKRLGITEDEFRRWRESPEVIKQAEDALKELKGQSDALQPSFVKIRQGIENFFKAGDDAKKLEDALNLINDGVNEIMVSVGFFSDTFNKLGDSFGGVFGGIADGFNIAMESVNSAMQGAQAGSMFGPIGASAGAAIGLVTSLASSIAKIHDSKNEKRIERLQDQIDTLDRSYDNLGRSIEEAYSKDASNLINQQNKLLEQQKLLIQNQIKEEQDKKKTDDERIKEWQNQIEDINQTIEDNKQSAVDAIFGEDVQSAIENFSSSLADAWANGTDASKSARDVVRQMMQQMVTESVKSAIKASGQMEQIRKKLQEFYADNVLTGWEQDYIYNMADKLQEELDKQFDWASDLFKNEEEGSSSQQSASSRGFGTEMTHEDAGELSGRFTALQITGEESKEQLIQISQFSKMLVDSNMKCVENIDGLVNLTIISNQHLENIAKHTRLLVSIEDLLVKIEDHSKNL